MAPMGPMGPGQINGMGGMGMMQPTMSGMGFWAGDAKRGDLTCIKGQLGVPLTMYPWYLLDSLGILGD